MKKTLEVKEADIATREEYSPVALPMAEIIQSAIQKDSPLEVMQTLIAFQEKREAKWAKEQFDRAMAEFQGKCPVIGKNKKGHTSSYASLDHIVTNVRNILQECGFSYRIEAEVGEGTITATCVSVHKDGHSERSSFTSKVDSIQSRDGKSVRSGMQDTAAALTFAKRYAFCNAFGIMTGDSDNDGAPASENRTVWAEKIGKCATREDLGKLLEEMKANEPEALKDQELVKAFNIKKASITA